MLFFIILFVIILIVSIPIYRKFRERQNMSESLLNGIQCDFCPGSYFDSEIKSFIDRKTLSVLRKNGHKGYDDDLRQVPEYQIKYNLNLAHVNKFVLDNTKYHFSDEFIDYVRKNRSFAYIGAFKSVLDEYFVRKLQDSNNERLKMSVEKLNSVFLEEFDKTFEAAQKKLEENPVIDYDVVIPDKVRNVLKKYVHRNTMLLFQRKRLNPKNLYGEYTSEYKKEYNKQYVYLKNTFFDGDCFSKEFVKFVKSTYKSKNVDEFEQLIPIYINFLDD